MVYQIGEVDAAFGQKQIECIGLVFGDGAEMDAMAGLLEANVAIMEVDDQDDERCQIGDSHPHDLAASPLAIVFFFKRQRFGRYCLGVIRGCHFNYRT